ncbi:hypothetical protein A3768_5490 (plasmid) [Ralstonia solanacearum]|nr:hypothetical protein A3768_5490 [Ralstonia solanacearum]
MAHLPGDLKKSFLRQVNKTTASNGKPHETNPF